MTHVQAHSWAAKPSPARARPMGTASDGDSVRAFLGGAGWVSRVLMLTASALVLYDTSAARERREDRGAAGTAASTHRERPRLQTQ